MSATSQNGSGIFQLNSKPLDWPGYGRGFFQASQVDLGTTPGNVFPVASFICLANMAGMVRVIDCHFLEAFPEPLQEMLADPQVITVGGYWARIQEALSNRFPDYDPMMAKSIIQLGIPPLIDPTGTQGANSAVLVDLPNLIEFFMGPSVREEVIQLRQHWALILNNPSSGLLPLTARNEPDLLMQCMGRTAVWTLDVLLMRQVNRPIGDRLPSEAYDLPKLFHHFGISSPGISTSEVGLPPSKCSKCGHWTTDHATNYPPDYAPSGPHQFPSRCTLFGQSLYPRESPDQ